MPAAPPDAQRQAPSAEAVQSRRRSRPMWVAIRILVFVVLAVIVVKVISANTAELSGSTDYVEGAGIGWIGLALLAEAASYANFTLLQRHLLGTGGLRVGLVPLGAMSLAGNAMNNSLPGGGAFATVFAFRQFRRRGADEALTTWTLVAFTALTAITLAVLSVVGLAVAGGQGPAAGLAPLIGLLLFGPLVGMVIMLRPRVLTIVATPVLRWVHRTLGVPRRDPGPSVARLVARLRTVSPTMGDWAWGVGFAAGNWVSDCVCLILAFIAVGAAVPWRGLLLAYAAAQVAANLPVTPGGLGVVEGSLTIGLVAFGGSTAQTVAAVLIYRIISFWLVLPIGWLAWLGLTLEGRRHHPMPEGVEVAL